MRMPIQWETGNSPSWFTLEIHAAPDIHRQPGASPIYVPPIQHDAHKHNRLYIHT